MTNTFLLYISTELNEDFDINLVEQNKLNLALNDSMIMAKGKK